MFAAVAFLSGCATNGYLPASQPQQPVVIQQTAAQQQPWLFNGATAKTDDKLKLCKVIFADKTEAVFKNTTCAELMAKHNGNGNGNGNGGDDDVKVVYVNAPAQQPAVVQAAASQQQVSTTATSLSGDPLVRSGVGAGVGALVGLGANALAGGNRDNRKKAVFGGGVLGFLVGLFTSPSSPAQTVAAPGYGYGGAPAYGGGGYYPVPSPYPYGHGGGYGGHWSAAHLLQMRGGQLYREGVNLEVADCGRFTGDWYSQRCQRLVR
ncbi:MAG: hypothetical protein Q8Q36_02455 [bacterium]|nr:hypothetical protein [bacterium]